MGVTSANDAVGTEDVCCVVAGWTGEDGHVLDHAEDLERAREREGLID